MTATIIEWKDITSSDGWHTLNALEKFITDEKNGVCKMIGFVYEEDEKQLVLVDSTITVSGQKQFGTIHIIPKGCIISRKDF